MSTTHKKADKNSATARHKIKSKKVLKNKDDNGEITSNYTSETDQEDMATGQKVSTKRQDKNGKSTGSTTVDSYTETDLGDGRGYLPKGERRRLDEKKKNTKIKRRVSASPSKRKIMGALN
jgi:hypothetical protein